MTPVLIAIGCLVFAVILTILIVILFYRKKITLALFVFEFIALQATLLAFLYFNASVPPVTKINDLFFYKETQEEGMLIQDLFFEIDTRTVKFTQEGQKVETPFALLSTERLQFVSPLDNKSYFCDISNNNFCFWSNNNFKIILYPEKDEEKAFYFSPKNKKS